MDTDAAEVLIVGSLNMDLIALAPQLPRLGETVLGTRFATSFGGKGSNQAVAAARLGAHVSMIGRLGSDAYGTVLRQALVEEGIDCEAIGADREESTGVALITVDETGRNTIVVVPGSNARLQPTELQAHRTLFERTRIVVCQLETPLATVTATVALGAALGKFVILNPAPAPEPSALEPALLRQVNLLVPNDVEAARLTGLPVESVPQAIEAARVLHSRGAREVIVTLGEQGLVHSRDGVPQHHRARTTRAVDTTAAGDTFIGALAAALAQGESMQRAIAIGQVAASIAVSRIGAQSSIPRRAEVMALL
jgi:ribokinase